MVIVNGAAGVSVNSVASKMVLPAMFNDLIPNDGEMSWKLPFNTSPNPAALVPLAKSDSSTLPSVPTTAPSFRPKTAGTPTMVTVNVVVALSLSLSVTR